MKLADAYAEFTYAKDHTPASQQWYRSRLTAFFAWLGEQDIDQLEAINAPLVRRYIDQRRRAGTLSSHTLHGHARAIKAFLNWAASDDLIDERLPRRIAMPVKEQYVIATFTPDQISRLFAAAAKTPTPLRDKALLSVLLDCGTRAAELCGLLLDKTVLTADDSYITVAGKGRKSREIGLGSRSRLALAKYLHRERGASASPYVFLTRSGTPLRTEGLDRLLYRLRDAAGVEHFNGVRVSAHTFRHTFAVAYLTNGGDLYKLSRLMGHSTVTTTEGYLKSFKARDARMGMSVLDSMSGKGR